MPVIPAPGTTSSETSSSLVSGHNALWCLISLGLTSMLQPSAFGSKSLAFSPARISPFVCIAETLVFLSSTAYLFYSGSTPHDSITGFVQTYYQQDRSSPQLWLFRLVVFLLNALPQALTLCGMHGVPWTKTWGLVLFFSAISDGVMQLLASKYSLNAHAPQVRLTKQQEDALDTICRVYGVAAGIVHLGFCCWAFVIFWDSNEDLGQWFHTLYVLFVFLCFIYIVFCRRLGFRPVLSFSTITRNPVVAYFVFLMFIYDKKSVKSITITPLQRTSDVCSSILTFVVCGWALSALTDRTLALLGTYNSLFQPVAVQDPSSPAASFHGRNASYAQGAGPPAPVSALSTPQSHTLPASPSRNPSLSPTMQAPKPTPSKKNKTPLYDSHSPAFALGTLGLAAIYYLVLFDSEGTRQASWTEVLA